MEEVMLLLFLGQEPQQTYLYIITDKIDPNLILLFLICFVLFC